MSLINLSRLTPAGRGGVATLTLKGTNAKNAFLLRFISKSNLTNQVFSPTQPYFGKLRLDEIDQCEEIVARIIDSDNVEIHCHGGAMIFSAIEKSFARDGIKTKNLFDSAESNSQRELALRLLPFAITERVAKILIDQYHGAMERELAEINKLNEIIEQYKTLAQTPKITESNASKVTADFINSEQLKSLLVPHDYQLESKLLSSSIDETHSTSCIDNEKQLEHLQSQLRERQNRLEENRLIGRHLIKPFRVVLSGDVNVGKSSLFNAILGYNRAITSSTPGTTRDVVVAQTAVDGFPVEFYDTAGIHEVDKNIEKNKIEHEGIKRSIEQIAEADLIIRVVDLTSEIVNDFNLSSGIIVTKNSDSLNIVTKNILTCYNKADLVSDLPDEICVSAKTGLGVAELMEKIARILIPNPPRPFEAVPLK